MACSKNERHRYGQHYTPVHVARLLAAFAVRNARDRVLDPSCGDGRLLGAALERKLEMAARQTRRKQLTADLSGIDRSLEAIVKAKAITTNTAVLDFFDIRPGSYFHYPFDAIIGNPPYIRQEVMGTSDKRRISERLQSNRDNCPSVFLPTFSGRSDIYVFFFAHAVNFLRDGGRLVFLTSSSWLDSGYGAALREFLLRNFKIVSVVQSAVESFFDDASVNTVITVLERCTDHEARRKNQVKFVHLTSEIEDGAELAVEVEGADEASNRKFGRLRVIKQQSLGGTSGWGRYLRAHEVFFVVTERGSGLRRLGELARVRFGVKTGANDFFYVAGTQSLGSSQPSLKTLSEIATVRRGLTTGANEFFYLRGSDRSTDASPRAIVCDSGGAQHSIETCYLSPVVFSLKELSGIRLHRPPAGKLFFNCHSRPDDLRDTGALEYIRLGERAGYHRRPSCSTRDPWYAVARGMKPAPLLFPSKVGERWLIAVNEARVFEDKKLYGIFPCDGVSVKTLAALLNSTWARYYTEVTCRQMTGAQAIADIDVTVADQLLIPDPRGLTDQLETGLGRALDSLKMRPVVSIFEEIKRADRYRLDDLTLRAMGFAKQAERAAILERLYLAVVELVGHRLAGSRNK
jgi:methylase of polypeptide subunit release factors